MFTNKLIMKVYYNSVTNVNIRQQGRTILRLANNPNTKVYYIPVTSVNISQDGSEILRIT